MESPILERHSCCSGINHSDSVAHLTQMSRCQGGSDVLVHHASTTHADLRTLEAARACYYTLVGSLWIAARGLSLFTKLHRTHFAHSSGSTAIRERPLVRGATDALGPWTGWAATAVACSGCRGTASSTGRLAGGGFLTKSTGILGIDRSISNSY